MCQSAFQLVPLGDSHAPEPAAGRLEAQLIQSARTSPEAFAQLYRQNYSAMLIYIRRRVGDEHIANDLVAETFLAALKNLHAYRDRGLPFRAWLYRLASSCVSRWARRLPKQSMLSMEQMEEQVEDSGRGADALTEITRWALLSLPVRYQDTLALFYIEGLSIEEVTRVLGSRTGTIKARLSRGRAMLRRKLAPYEEDLLK